MAIKQEAHDTRIVLMSVYKSRTGYRKPQLHGNQTNKRERGREKANGKEERRRAGRNNVKGRGTKANQAGAERPVCGAVREMIRSDGEERNGG